MSSVNIDLAADTILNVMVGQQDENEVREVVFDFSDWYTTYGSGTISLAIQRPKDEWPYDGTLTVDNSTHKATWEISDTDSAYAGVGQIQLSYTVGTAKKKSVVYRFTVHKSLGALGNVITPIQIQTFIDEVTEALEDMQEELTDIKEDFSYQFDNTKHESLIICNDIEHGHGYSTADGAKVTASSFCCSRNLLKVKDGSHVYVSEIGQTVTITQYDENLNLVDYCVARLQNLHYIYQCTDSRVKYIGLTTAENSSLSSIKIRQLEATEIVEYPYTSDNYCYADNRVYTTNGTAASSTSWACVNLCDVKPGDKYYTNSQYQQNFICFDATNTVLPVETPYVEVPYGGRIYTIPNNAAYCWVNIQKSKTHGDISVVYYKITKSEKILAIGDSITWLDNRNGYDGATSFLGWQKQLQKIGYQVDSAGYSGYSYATGTQDGSIYTEIVTNQYDVSGYDYVILFGGTNDDLYAVSLGSRCTNYSQTTFDASTFNGALCGIIKYIRDNNPSCKIILCTTIKSEASVRQFTEAVTYVDEIKYNAVFWSCYLNDLFSNFNVSPFTDGFDLYYYDNTHPNKAGMARIGALMITAIEQA